MQEKAQQPDEIDVLYDCTGGWIWRWADGRAASCVASERRSRKASSRSRDVRRRASDVRRRASTCGDGDGERPATGGIFPTGRQRPL